MLAQKTEKNYEHNLSDYYRMIFSYFARATVSAELLKVLSACYSWVLWTCLGLLWTNRVMMIWNNKKFSSPIPAAKHKTHNAFRKIFQCCLGETLSHAFFTTAKSCHYLIIDRRKSSFGRNLIIENSIIRSIFVLNTCQNIHFKVCI